MTLEGIVKSVNTAHTTTAAPLSLEARFAQGEMAAVEEIMLAHQHGMYQLGLRLFGQRDKAADFFQDVFIKVYEKHRHYNPTRPLKPWLYRVAMNLGRDRLRQKQEIVMEPESLPDPGQMPQAEDLLMQAERREMVWRVINSLHPTYREIMALRFSSGLSISEIAAVLGIGLGAAKVRLCRGLKAFEDSFPAPRGERHDL